MNCGRTWWLGHCPGVSAEAFEASNGNMGAGGFLFGVNTIVILIVNRPVFHFGWRGFSIYHMGAGNFRL